MSSFSLFTCITNFRQRRCFCCFIRHIASTSNRFPYVDNHQHRTGKIKCSTKGTHRIQPVFQNGYSLKEVTVFQSTVFVKLLPHQTLSPTCNIHRNYPEKDTQSTNPEVCIRHLHRRQLGVEHFRNQPINHTKDDETVPSQSPYVNVCRNPVREVPNFI